jgi:hypothetical protein
MPARVFAFRSAHQEARAAHTNGDRDVAFPEGTWAPKMRCGIPSAPAPT